MTLYFYFLRNSNQNIEADFGMTPKGLMTMEKSKADAVNDELQDIVNFHNWLVSCNRYLANPDEPINNSPVWNTVYVFSCEALLDYCNEKGLLICAICAAPIILGKKGLLEGKNAICFPGFEDELIGAEISDKFVCKDGNIITAKGMGSAINFGLEIVSAIKDKTFADNLKSTLQCS